MKFKPELTIEQKTYLESEYKEYIKSKKFTDEERAALCAWVKEGNSVYDNQMMMDDETGHCVEFIEVWRSLNYIEKKIGGSTEEEYKRFALEYFGMNSDFID